MGRVSRKAREMPPFYVMEILERAVQLEREGRSIIHMEVGEPDFDTPEVIMEAGIRAMRDGRTHYTHSLGHPELREAIAQWMLRKYGVSVSPERVVVTIGSSGAMILLFSALLDPGDNVIMTNPHYACYPNFVTACGGIPRRLTVTEEDGFQYDPAKVASSMDGKSRAVIINSPANPTGTTMRLKRMEAVVNGVAGRATIVSDEIYHGLTYGEKSHSILEVSPDAVVISGFSKLFAMTGWRLGYLVLPEHLVRPVQKLQQNLFISPPDFAQFAAIAALTKADTAVEAMRSAYDERRRLVLRRLGDMGLTPLVEPKGAFYVFVNVSKFTDSVLKFSYEILEEAGVALTPGIDFGPQGEGFIRIAYTNSMENLAEGMDRLEAFFSGRSANSKDRP